MRWCIARNFIAVTTLVLLAGCAGKILQIERAEEVLKTDEFDKKVVIEEAPVEPPALDIKEGPTVEAKPSKKKKAKTQKTSVKEKRKEKGKLMERRQPELEDSVGFDGRRPLVDPFRVGEKMTFDISYFRITAGTLEVETKPYATVNGVKAYHFEMTGKSNSFFSKIYAVDDKAVTYVSYDDLIPLNLQISLKESKQLAEARTFFDWKTKRASYWQKKFTEDKGERSKKIEWDLLPYSQNVISAAYYMRIFQYEPGKNLAFRVADEGKNIVFKGQVLRREKISTEAGEFNTIVMKPELTVDGIFKPVGEILIWLTDDDRKFLVRLESKIKIGTVVAKLKSLDKGRD